MMEIISRKEAKAKGLKRYFTGAPCKRGHCCERAVVNRECIKCHRGRSTEYGRIWSAKNPERRRAIRKKWALYNVEKIRVKDGRYRASNKERLAARKAAWRDRSVDHIRIYRRKYYAENRANVTEYRRISQKKMRLALRALNELGIQL
jgi:hypothetical protein